MKKLLFILFVFISIFGYSQGLKSLLMAAPISKPPLLTTSDNTSAEATDCSGWSYPHPIIGSGVARINLIFFEPDLTIIQIKITEVNLDGMSTTYDGVQIAVDDIIDFSAGNIIFSITAYTSTAITSSYKYQILTSEYTDYSDEVTTSFTFGGCTN